MCVYVCVCIYIYSHSQMDCFIVSQLFSVARHARFSKLGLKLCRLITVHKGILKAYVSLFVLLS